MTSAATPTRVCFQLRVDEARLDEYLARHAPVWPEMLREIEASGRRNYSLFLGTGGTLVGFYETDDDAASRAYLAASEIASRWEAEMSQYFVGLGGRPDQSAATLTEVFNLHDQLTAATAAAPTPKESTQS